MKKSLLAAATALTASIASSTASITFDLRAFEATGGSIAGGSGGKSVLLNGAGSSTVTFQIWAQLTNAAPIAGAPFGIQVILGSIKTSAGIEGSLGSGSFAPAVFDPLFSNQATVGAAAELSAAADGIGDLGSNATTPNTSFIKARKDPTSGGQQVGTVFFATNNSPAGATFNAITNGYEFLMGTATLTISNFTNPNGRNTVNWVIPAFTTPANRGQIAQWTDGDNAVNNGNTQFADMFVGAPVSLVVVPEPSAFGMVLLGAMGLVGFRRMGLRKS